MSPILQNAQIRNPASKKSWRWSVFALSYNRGSATVIHNDRWQSDVSQLYSTLLEVTIKIHLHFVLDLSATYQCALLSQHYVIKLLYVIQNIIKEQSVGSGQCLAWLTSSCYSLQLSQWQSPGNRRLNSHSVSLPHVICPHIFLCCSSYPTACTVHFNEFLTWPIYISEWKHKDDSDAWNRNRQNTSK